MNRQELVLTLRKLLLRMEREECELEQELGFSWDINQNTGIKQYKTNGIDTFTLKFLGPKRNSHIPPVTVVYCDGKTEERSYTNIRGLHNVVHMYCPINPNTISPERHRRRVSRILQSANVQFIKDSQ